MGNRQPKNPPAKEEVETSAVVLSLQAPDSNNRTATLFGVDTN